MLTYYRSTSVLAQVSEHVGRSELLLFDHVVDDLLEDGGL